MNEQEAVRGLARYVGMVTTLAVVILVVAVFDPSTAYESGRLLWV